MKTRKLTLLSVLIFLIPFAIFFLSASKDIGDLGSLLGAFSGIIAVIWFYRGLRLQSLQIDEQRQQFSKQHHLQYQDSLLTFLEKASDKIESGHKELIEALGLTDSGQLSVKYMHSMNYYKDALESTDPNVVMSNVQEWMKIEGPCVKFMSSVKDIITLHKRRLGLDDDNKNMDVGDYVFINSGHLLQQPFMSSYQVSVKMLSEQMMILSPGRRAMALASTTATALLAPKGLMKKEKIIEDIKDHKSKNKPIPKICEKIIC
jgi:hypothetical protein